LRALQYAMVVLLQGVLVVALVSGIRLLGHVEPAGHPGPAASVPHPASERGSVREDLAGLSERLQGVSR
jgi:hypothetical protein